MASAEMQKLFTIGKYKVYFANESFMYQGFWLWTGKRNVRVIPLNRLKNWTGKEK